MFWILLFNNRYRRKLHNLLSLSVTHECILRLITHLTVHFQRIFYFCQCQTKL